MAIYFHKIKFMVLASKRKHRRKPRTHKLTFRKNPAKHEREHRVLAVVIDYGLKRHSHILIVNMYTKKKKNYFC